MNALPDQMPLSLDRRPVRDFSTFWSGPNQAVVDSLRCAQPGDLFVLSGPEASGKSHLLSAFSGSIQGGQFLAGRALHAADPEVLRSFHSSRRIAFDDVDHLFGNPQWERSLFIAFNEWRAAGCAIAFSLSPGYDWDSISLADLRSRLHSGIRLRLHELDDDENQHLLCSLAQARNIMLSEEVVRLMIHRLPRDTASQIRWLERLAQESLRRKRRITPALVHALIREAS